MAAALRPQVEPSTYKSHKTRLLKTGRRRKHTNVVVRLNTKHFVLLRSIIFGPHRNRQ